jgi:RND family efflux transporter MFP subunit
VRGGTLCALCLAAAGCAKNEYKPPPPPRVEVTTPEVETVQRYHYYTGNTEASKTVEVRARVQGYLSSINFRDGADVNEGDLLFVIDQQPYQAQLDQAKADLQGRQAAAVKAQSVYERNRTLLASGAITPEQIDVQRGDYLTAQAAVVQAEAAVRAAQLNLDFTEIRAPFSGRAGRRMVDVGNLVSANTTLLTTIRKNDPMYVYFTASEANYLDYLKRLRKASKSESTDESSPKSESSSMEKSSSQSESRSAESSSSQSESSSSNPPNIPIEMALANENGFPHKGTIDFGENTVDPTTGTIQVRGVFANPPPHVLRPGLFVRLRVPVESITDALLVPDRAIGNDQAGPYLLVLDKNNVVQRRRVVTGERSDQRRIIASGLEPDERLIVEGLQHAQPGKPVEPVQEPVETAERKKAEGSQKEEATSG